MKNGQWMDTKSWFGWPRATWVMIALVVGIIINIILIKAFDL